MSLWLIVLLLIVSIISMVIGAENSFDWYSGTLFTIIAVVGLVSTIIFTALLVLKLVLVVL